MEFAFSCLNVKERRAFFKSNLRRIIQVLRIENRFSGNKCLIAD